MNTIKDYIEGTVEANLKRVMAGDDAIPPNIAINIALEAANMAATAAAKSVVNQKRFELACLIAGRLVMGEDVTADYACESALIIVDTMVQTIAAEKVVADGEQKIADGSN